jgi:hypothetical protein
MDRSLFWLPADEINLDDVNAFLNQHLEETSVLEYTEIRSDQDMQGVLAIITAMANTDGGIILVGISKDSKKTNQPGSLVGIDPKFIDSLKNKCRSSLQPAFVPEIIQVKISEKEEVFLLVRINPEMHPRPVVLREKGVLVRVGDSNQVADLFRLKQLFSESGRGFGLPVPLPQLNPSSGPTLDDPRDLLVRFVITGYGTTPLVFDSVTKRKVLDALANSPIDKWMRNNSRPVSWNWGKPMDSHNLTINCPASEHYGGQPGPMPNLAIGARLMVALPGLQNSGSILLDIWLKELPKQSDAPAWYPLTVSTFYHLLLTGLATITDPSVNQYLPTGLLLWDPHLYIHIAANKTPWLNLNDMECVGSLRADDSFEIKPEWSESQRMNELDRMVKDMLCKFLSDYGCIDHEMNIQALQPRGILNP